MAATQNAPENTATEQPKKKKKGLLIAIIIILILVLLAGAFVGYAFFTKTFFFSPKDANEVKAETIKETMYPLDSFVVNLDSNGSRRYLKVTIALGCAEKKDIKKITEKEYQLRDVIISTLRDQDIEDLQSVEKEDEIKQSLITNINTLFEPDLSINIYYTEYIIQ